MDPYGKSHYKINNYLSTLNNDFIPHRLGVANRTCT